MEFFERAGPFAASRQRVALVTVVETRGSVPRHVGARMIVDEAGECCLTIGGGRVEAEVTSLAAKIASGEAPSQVVTHHLVRDLAMCCGGSMTFLVEKLDDVRGLADVASQLEGRHAVLVETTLGGGLHVERTSSRTGPSWDGEVFAETLWPRERAIIFGAGHVSRALMPLLSATGFELIVCDDNELGALDLVEQDADRIVASFEVFDVVRSIGELGPSDFALVLTRDHAVDQRLVEKLLAEDRLGYIGLIGSLGKVGRFRRRLLAKGVVSEAQWARLSAPIGVDIGAETPSEIAVSICAELIARRAAGRRATP